MAANGAVPALGSLELVQVLRDHFSYPLHTDDERTCSKLNWRDEPLLRDLDRSLDEADCSEPETADNCSTSSEMDLDEEMDGPDIDMTSLSCLSDESSFNKRKYQLHVMEKVYDFCDASQLRQLVLDRGIVDPCPGQLTLKYYYVQLLLAADKFPFMRLLPELRTMVYHHLLDLRRSKQTQNLHAYPQILQTSRQINKEATSILYGNTIICEFHAKSDGSTLDGHGSVHNKQISATCIHSQFLNVPNAMDHYPEMMRRITRLEVRVYLLDSNDDSNPTVDAATSINHFLLGLSSFLTEGHSLTSLKVVTSFSTDLDIAAVSRMLYPLRRIRKVPVVEITNGSGCLPIPEKITSRLIADLQSSKPVNNTMRQYSHMLREVTSLLDLSSTTHTDECAFHGYDGGHCEDVAMLQASVFLASSRSCMSSALEGQFQARLVLLADSLDSVDLEAAKVMLAVVEKNRKAREEYGETLDSRQLRKNLVRWQDVLEDDPEDDMEGSNDWSDAETSFDVSSELGGPLSPQDSLD